MVTKTKIYIKKVRAQLGLTQVEFAKVIGKSHDTVKKYEKGAIYPSLPTWFRIQRLDETIDLD